MIKVSIVVPVYNVEKYLERCLDSLINQTLQEIEIIIVNDGSRDSSPEICEKYEKKYSNIIFISQKNQGLSAARNTGIKIAKGQFLGFVDSDDFVEPDMYELLYNNAINNDCEISCCGHFSYYENGIKHVNTKKGIKRKYTKSDAMDLFLNQEYFDVTAWNKIYRRELFENIEYPVGKLYEDILTTYKLIDKSKNVYLDSQPKYYYFQRNDSIAHNEYNEKTYGIIDAINSFVSFSKQKYPQNKNVNLGKIRWYLVVANKMIASDYNDPELFCEIKRMIKKNVFKIIVSRYIPCIRKIQMLLFYSNFNAYKKIYKRTKNR